MTFHTTFPCYEKGMHLLLAQNNIRLLFYGDAVQQTVTVFIPSGSAAHLFLGQLNRT